MFPSAFIALKPIMCKKRVFRGEITRFSAFNRRFLLRNAFKLKEKLVLGLDNLIRHNSMRFHVSQCFHCVKTDNEQKTRF